MFNKKPTVIPESFGLIMDGNGRWAKRRGLPRSYGHGKGLLNMIALCKHGFELGCKNIVCYGLSIQNLGRDQAEVSHIYKLVIEAFDLFVKTFSELEASVCFIGDNDLLPPEIQQQLKKTTAALSQYENSGKKIYIAIAYGSRNEMLTAINSAIEKGEKVDEKSFLSSLSCPVEPDLLIRTGGEFRLSNFLLFQSSYSELCFSKKLFPDFSNKDLEKAFVEYGKRNRRFGLVKK